MSHTRVFGHQNPDMDTVASAIAAAHLLNMQAPSADTFEAAMLGPANLETQFALTHFDVTAPDELAASDTTSVVLVDHNEAAQSVANLADCTVAAIFDHHKFDFSNATPLMITAKPWGSVSTILYYEYQQAGITIPAAIAGLLLSGIISDTLLLKSPTTTVYDEQALPELAALAGVADTAAYGIALLKAGTDLSSRTDQELIDGDAKSFEMGGQTFRIGQVNTVDIADVLARQAGIEAAMAAEQAASGYDNFLFVITDILNSNSQAIFLGQATAAVETAFNGPLTNNVVDLPGVVSRKKQVVPPLQATFG